MALGGIVNACWSACLDSTFSACYACDLPCRFWTQVGELLSTIAATAATRTSHDQLDEDHRYSAAGPAALADGGCVCGFRSPEADADRGAVGAG
jgi:hypothetical protein